MKGPSSKQFDYHGRDNNNSYENVEPVAPHQNHHMSGAYIRGLVKQLSYAATTDSNMSHSGLRYPPGGEAQEQQQQHRPRHKKQVRRRLHTSRPYQDKLLNMAEARREIVTALKFHRAAMKEAAKTAAADTEQQQKPEAHAQPQYQSLTSQTQYNPQSASISSPLMSSNTANCCSDYNDYQRASFSSYLYPPPPPLQNHFDSPFSLIDENLINLQSLPNQTLGLNLNFNDFESVYHSSPSASSPINTDSPIDTSTNRDGEADGNEAAAGGGGGGGGMADFHAAMGEEEMEAIRWIGEQHQMEWSDTLNLVTSAWWFKVDHGEDSKIECNDEDQTNNYVHVGPFSEHPTWLKGGPSYDDICSNQQQQRGFNDGSSSSSFHDPHAPPLPCVDNIGEIEGLDMEWLS